MDSTWTRAWPKDSQPNEKTGKDLIRKPGHAIFTEYVVEGVATEYGVAGGVISDSLLKPASMMITSARRRTDGFPNRDNRSMVCIIGLMDECGTRTGAEEHIICA